MGSPRVGFGFNTPIIFILVIILIVLCSPLSVSAQTGSRRHPLDAGQTAPQDETVPKEIADKMAKEQLKSRYANLKRDSERLLELATELKQYVDKSGENTMSLEVIRKCEDIEKLSKSVRTKMKGD